MSGIGTKKIDLGDGDFAVIFTEMKHGTKRRVEQITRKFLVMPAAQIQAKEVDGKIKTDFLVNGKVTPEEEVQAVDIDWVHADFTEATDAMILGQVQDWSFGPVDQSVLDDMAEAKREALARACDAEYGAVPLPGSGGGV